MSKELEDLIGQRFIQRTDVKAIQRGEGYAPHTDTGKRDGNRIGWDREAIREHIAGRASYGHYLVDRENQSKLFAFDIDLSTEGMWVGIEENGSWSDMAPKECKPREAWAHPKCPENLKRFLTSQLMHTAQRIAELVDELIEVPIAIAYSGSKGVHVYALTGTAPAIDCREAATEIIEYTGDYEKIRGDCFYGPKDRSAKAVSSCIDIEIFPKQTDLDGKDLGNLMRLPLGENAKGGRSFFLGLNEQVDSMKEIDPIDALKAGNPWQ